MDWSNIHQPNLNTKKFQIVVIGSFQRIDLL